MTRDGEDTATMKMSRERLYKLIRLQPEITKRLRVIGSQIDSDQIERELAQMLDGDSAEEAYYHLDAVFQGDTDHLKMLYCQMECACRIYERYLEKNIPDTIYIDTMKCFTRFIEECKKKNGRMLFDRGWWTYRQVSMNLFRIGALEYQFKKYDGENVIAIHIPSDADFSKESVDMSIEQADLFFKTYYGNYNFCKYTCNSWLLSQSLKPLLSETSNILSFQRRFRVVEEDQEDKSYLEWLFQVLPDTDIRKLPSVTGLQKKVKEMLLKGGKVGSACGIMKRD